jgi:anti-anti-sigma factor
MKIRRRDYGDVTVLDLDGHFSGGPDAEVFAVVIGELVQQERLNTALVFRNVSWINSSGIGILARNHAHYVRGGGRLVVAELNSRISILFEMMLRNIFEIHETELQAIEALQKETSKAQG